MKNAATLACALLAGALLCGPAQAQASDEKKAAPPVDQKAMMEAFAKMGAVGENHKLLAGMAGEWTMRTKMWMAPEQPPEETTGSVSSRMILGGRYLHALHNGSFMGQPFEGVSVTGYDNLTQRFVSTWSDSMSTGIYYQTGTYDPATKTFTYRGEVPDPLAGGAIAPVRTTTRVLDADTFVFEWYETHDGAEARTMEVTYTRKK